MVGIEAYKLFSHILSTTLYSRKLAIVGMLDLLRGGSSPRLVKSAERRSRSSDSGKSPERSADTEAIIKLSHYPSAELKKDVEPAIEREDWPAPPAMAVITKNLGRLVHTNTYICTNDIGS